MMGCCCCWWGGLRSTNPYASMMVDIMLPRNGNLNCYGMRPVHQIISMIEWIRISSSSINNSLSGARPRRLLLLHGAASPQTCFWAVRTLQRDFGVKTFSTCSATNRTGTWRNRCGGLCRTRYQRASTPDSLPRKPRFNPVHLNDKP